MRVCVTGATGFLGSHIVAALVARGHEVRVLARTPSKVEPALAPHGGLRVEVVQGDVTDPDAVRLALEGCDAVIHAANVYSFDARRAEEMLRVNEQGTRNVLTLAHAAGCDPIVHVSSIVALPPMAHSDTPYIRSKVAAERVAKELQEAGAPVVTTYPGAIFGPHDPGAGEQVNILADCLGQRLPFRFSGGLPVADVGWLARAHAGLVEPGLGPRRVTMAGTWVSWNDVQRTFGSLTGRWLLGIPVPAFAVGLAGWLCDQLQPRVPVRLPVNRETACVLLTSSPLDDAEARAIAGPCPQIENTLAGAICWATGAGHLPPALAGELAPQSVLSSRSQVASITASMPRAR